MAACSVHKIFSYLTSNLSRRIVCVSPLLSGVPFLEWKKANELFLKHIINKSLIELSERKKAHLYYLIKIYCDLKKKHYVI